MILFLKDLLLKYIYTVSLLGGWTVTLKCTSTQTFRPLVHISTFSVTLVWTTNAVYCLWISSTLKVGGRKDVSPTIGRRDCLLSRAESHHNCQETVRFLVLVGVWRIGNISLVLQLLCLVFIMKRLSFPAKVAQAWLGRSEKCKVAGLETQILMQDLVQPRHMRDIRNICRVASCRIYILRTALQREPHIPSLDNRQSMAS